MKNARTKHLDFIIGDMIALELAHFLTVLVFTPRLGAAAWESYRLLGFFVVVIMFTVIFFTEGYRDVLHRGYLKEFEAVVRQLLLFFALEIILLFLAGTSALFSRLFLIGAAVVSVGMIYAERLLIKAYLRRKFRKIKYARTLMIIATRDQAKRMIRKLKSHPLTIFKIEGLALVEPAAAGTGAAFAGTEAAAAPKGPDAAGAETAFAVREAAAASAEGTAAAKAEEAAAAKAEETAAAKTGETAAAGAEEEPDTVCGIPVSCRMEEVLDYAGSHVIDEILISIPGRQQFEADLAKRFLSIGLVTHIYMEQYFQEIPNCQQERLSDMNVMTCYNREVPLWMTAVKRLVDLAGGLVGTALAVLIGLLIGPLIYLKSPGPIVFSQIRVGKNGRRFRFYKFRSMYPDAEARKKELMEQNEISGHMFKMENDPRIIPGIGTFIRKTSLDEFPQFFNVLKGDMSLVGTRPPTVGEYEAYNFDQNKRLSMKPGLTGIWQISGRGRVTDFDEVVRMDCEYIDSWSIELDVKIILQTILVVLGRRGGM